MKHFVMNFAVGFRELLACFSEISYEKELHSLY